MSHPLVDFGPAAEDYARHRPGFPDEFFNHVSRYAIGVSGQRILDLGAGTGALARGFAQRGCQAIGLDLSPEMLEQALALDRAAGLSLSYVVGAAEAIGFKNSELDVVCAGQCWHWFDRERAAQEVLRVLRPGGSALIAYLSYLPDAGTLAAATEALILKHNPEWPFAGHDGRLPFFVSDLTGAGLRHLDTFWFDTDLPFSHESWRGRLRACNAALTMTAEKIAEFDANLAALLSQEYADPMMVGHRIFGIVAQKSSKRRA